MSPTTPMPVRFSAVIVFGSRSSTCLRAFRVAATSSGARLSGRGVYSGYRGRECMPENLVGVVDEDEGKLPSKLLGHVLDVPLVPPREDHRANARPVRRQDLLLDAPDG